MDIVTTISGLNEKVLTVKSGNKYILVEIEPGYIVCLDAQKGNKFMTGWCGTLDEDEENLDYLEKYDKMYNKDKQEVIKKYESKIKELEASNTMLCKAILELTKSSNIYNDVRVSRKDFLKIHDLGCEELQKIMNIEKDKTPDEIENPIYGNNFTIHWHGIYCDCGDGATPYNHICPAIENCDDELDGEEYGYN